MKHSMLTIGFILIAVCFCLNLVNATGSEEKFKKTETESMVEAKLESKSKCENSCQICQKSVYQMKFQSMADCEGNGVCRDTVRIILHNKLLYMMILNFFKILF